MNKYLLMTPLLLLPVLAPAQPDPMDELPPPPAPKTMGREAHVEEWLARMREKNPEEYDQLMQLRKDNPEAFRAELRERLRYRRQMAHFKEVPKLYEFLTALPVEERNQILDQLAPPPSPGREGRGGRRPPPLPEMAPLEDDIRKLAAQYRQATPEDQPRLREEIRGKLAQLFDLRGQQRLQMIAEAEEDLAGLKQQLEGRHANRDKIIDRRLQEILAADGMEW